MLGAIAGDIIGSYYEHFPTKSSDFFLYREDSGFTDDTVLTAAVAQWLMDETDLVDMLHRYVAWYPYAGYGATFIRWAQCGEREPYDSWGNGSAMRVSPCAWFATSLEEAIQLATASSVVTHNHPDGVRGAVATAGAIYLARAGGTKDWIRDFVCAECDYDLTRSLSEIRERYIFDASCNGSVPEAITAFLESDGYETAIRNAVSLGGDADTQAAIAGAIAEAYYGPIPKDIYTETVVRLAVRLLAVMTRFYETVVKRPMFVA